MRRLALKLLAVTMLAAVLPTFATTGSAEAGWTWLNDDVSKSGVVASNLNSTSIAYASVHQNVYLVDPPSATRTDLGVPAVHPSGSPMWILQLALSGRHVFARVDSGIYEWVGGSRWLRIGGPAAAIYAARAGEFVGGVLVPYLYAIGLDGTLRRWFSPQGAWVDLGPGPVAEVAEVGVDLFPKSEWYPIGEEKDDVRLYLLSADRRTIWRENPGGSWSAVGGPAASITGGPTHLLAADTVTGRPSFYRHPYGGWSSLALPAGAAMPPFHPDGDFAIGPGGARGHTVYYLSPGPNHQLWATRAPGTPIPGVSVVTGWHLLHTGGARTLAVRADTARAPGDLVVAITSISTTMFTWPEIQALSGPFAGHALTGTAYAEARPVLTDWIGPVTMRVTGGTLPTSFHVEFGSDGLVHVRSAAAPAPGTYVFDLTAIDATGSSLRIPGNTVTVHGPATYPGVPPREPLNGWGGVTVTNCLNHGPMPVWVRDQTAGTGWTLAGTVPSQLRTDPATGAIVGCEPTVDSLRIAAPSGHLLEVAPIDLNVLSCYFRNDPDHLGCVHGRYRFTVTPGAPEDDYRVAR